MGDMLAESAYMLSKKNAEDIAQISNSVPWTDFSGSAVLNWTGGTPDGVSVYEYKYRVMNGICFFTFGVGATDGNGAASLTLNLPNTPSLAIITTAWVYVGVTNGVPVYCAATPTPSLVFYNLSATDGQAFELNVSGFYPVA